MYHRVVALLIGLSLLSSSHLIAAEKPVKGFWLSPDWILDEVSKGPVSSAQARQQTAQVLDRIKALGTNAVFMETYLRGYMVGPMTDRAGNALPVYPLTRFSDGGDMMAIVIEEAGKRGIVVHAWVHMLFWRTDNPQLTRPHHVSRSIWDDLVAAWLREGAGKLSGGDAQLALAAAQHLTDGRDEDLAGMLKGAKISTAEGVLQAFQAKLAETGAAPPSFLVSTPEGYLHPSAAKDHWMTLYLNAEDPRVADRLVALTARISEQYPGLAGIHLDHIRYPRGPQNVPRGLAGSLKVGMTFPGGTGGGLFKQWRQLLKQREATVTKLVTRVREAIRAEHALTAAVHPMYYFERDEWPTKLSADDFVSQDWHGWGLDMAMPMIYEADAARVGRVLKRLRFGLMEQEGRKTTVVPGVNRLGIVKALPAWVYFDFGGLRSIRNGTVD